MSVDANFGLELLVTTLAEKHMANVVPNYVLVMHCQRLEILVTDITKVNPVYLCLTGGFLLSKRHYHRICRCMMIQSAQSCPK